MWGTAGLAFARRLPAFLIASWVSCFGFQVAAQGDPAAEGPPATISADEISYDESIGAVIASGNVEIVHGERMLQADRVRYIEQEDQVVASGNVIILEPTGDVLFADYVELTDTMRNGVIENFRLILADNSRLAANGARRFGGRRTVMRRAVYSPCQVCEEEPDRAPVWQLKAGTIVHDEESQMLEYSNAWLEFLGIPVAYTPYFIHPDPTVERRSGLLTPRFGTSTAFGGFARIPVFWAISPSIDMTIEPIVTTNENPILALEYRQRLNDGLIEISGSGTEADRQIGDPLNPTVEQDEFRGHLFAEGQFDINDDWRWGFDYARATDRTYLNRYNFFGEHGETLESNLYAEGFFERSYAAGNVFGYQDLTFSDPDEEPLILPLLDYNYVGEADTIGGRWSFDANLRSTMRDNGADTRRLSLKAGYLIPFISDFGLATTVSASVQADGYHLDQTDLSGTPENNVVAGRVVPRLAVEMRYPFVRGVRGVRQVIEPVAAFMVTPSTGNPGAIPEEDSVVIELDDTNLLSEDRIPGLDRADTGQRAVVGIMGGLYGERGGRMTGFIGQSYRRPDNEAQLAGSDIEQGYSDYVGRLEIVPNKYLDLLYRFRVAESDFSLLRSELGASVGPRALRLTGDYIFIASEASAGAFPDREELNAEISSQLTDFWSIAGSTRRNLAEQGGPLEYGARITYQDECFQFGVRFRREFTSTVDVEETTTLSLELVFKNLGDVTAQQQVQSR